MLRALKTAALGMTAQQLNVDVIANNLANVNTTGYKKSEIEFQDLLYENIRTSNRDGRKGHEKPVKLQIGLGNRPISTYRSFSEGDIAETGNPLDVAINGKGFLQVQMPDGSYAYTRDGSLKVNSQGYLVTNSGLKISPEIAIPENTNSVQISQDGVVSVMIDGETEPQELGQIELVTFVNPAGLLAKGGNLFEVTEASGEPIYGNPGDEGFGLLIQGYLEKSNVDVAQEMINLIVAQRAYEINSKAVKTADELMAMTNNLKR
ncbi:MAG TPA: flagellar basal-body rod protein FlgG [Caldithrix abyssi]|uniref:Flagellar basal-body rod protein FlgG n=1 Tax=Caldithrix abyssi TaxID=187145 RepID=A0A7V5UDT9_CALAY|nr:flagellar basal-body rod protein FlgG [Caldithrix abyssi]